MTPSLFGNGRLPGRKALSRFATGQSLVLECMGDGSVRIDNNVVPSYALAIGAEPIACAPVRAR